MMHSQAEEWEMKAQNAVGENSSVKLELMSVDTDRRHLRERMEDLENEVREARHIENQKFHFFWFSIF